MVYYFYDIFIRGENMKLLAIDGNSIVNRAFYGIRQLSTKDGVYTNGIYGFLATLLRLVDLEKPDGVAVAFDLRSPTFRHKMYSEYKAGRKGMPEELAAQMPILKDLLADLGFSVLSLEGYEADDILGTLAKMAEKSPVDSCIIATGDRDSLQLVSDHTTVLLTVTKMGAPEITRYTPDFLKTEKGVSPKEMIEVKALMGDSSDNIPGVAGIGEKSAYALIGAYHSIDYIYENIASLEIKDSQRAKLIAGRDSAYLSKDLGTICEEVPLNIDFESMRTGDGDKLSALRTMRRLELFSLIPKFNLDNIQENEIKSETASHTCDGAVSCDFENFKKSITPTDNLYCICENGFTFIAGNRVFKTAGTEKAVEILSLPNKKYFHDIKSVYESLLGKVDIKNAVFDSLLSAYLLNPNGKDYTVDRLNEEYLNKSFDNPLLFVSLCEEMEKELEKTGMSSLLAEIEIPLARVLAGMEKVGFEVDITAIQKYGEELKTRIALLEREVIEDVGYEFNLNSPKQLGEALFEKMGLPYKKKTSRGYSTNAEVLEELRFISPTVDKILEYRALAKLKSTYCDGLVAAVCDDGRVRSKLNQTETRTGRISSSEPNLQNIPVRKEEGRKLRGFFKAGRGKVLVDADYSQIELRVLAHMAEDVRMISAFESGEDIHTATASEVFNMPKEMVTPQMRSSAKAVNFGIVYGIGAFSLAKDIGVSRAEAGNYIKNYLNTYQGVDLFMKKAVEDAKEKGYVTTLFARRRPIPEIRSSNGMLKAFGERVARNAPIQGTAADIIKIAMVKIFERLEKELPTAKLIMQVHDELIIEAEKQDAEKAAEILKTEMENAAKMSVKLLADVGIGKTWLEAKG